MPTSGLLRDPVSQHHVHLPTSAPAHAYHVHPGRSINLLSAHCTAPGTITLAWLCRLLCLIRQVAPQVKADKEREVRAGHDGTWVAHPALVGVALDIFNAGMSTPNQVGLE